MVLTDAERAARASEERSELARRKTEKDRILREARADRDYYNEARNKSAQQEVAAAAKLLLRVRYDVDGKKGRRPVELEGTTTTVSLITLLQHVEEHFQVPPNRQVWHPADEATFPIQPKAEALPSSSSFSSIDDFPSLEAVGLRNGQELFLTVAEDEPASPPMTDSQLASASTAPAEPKSPAAAPVVPTVQPVVPKPKPSPAPAPAPAPQPAATATRHSDEARLKYLWRTIETQKLNLTKARDARLTAEVDRFRANPETSRLAGLLLWTKQEMEFYSRLKAELHRTVGLEPVKEFIVQRLRDAAGRHVLKEGKQPHRHVLISGAFGVGKRFASELIGRLFCLLTSRLSPKVRVGSRVRLAAWHDEENRGALTSKNDVGIVTEDIIGSHTPFRVQGPSGRFGNYREEELVAETDLLITLNSLGELVDPKSGQLRVAERTCYYTRLTGALAESDAGILEGVLEKGSIVIMTGAPDVIEANLQVSVFRRRQPDLLTLPTLTPTDVANLIAMGVEQRGYAGVGEGDVGTHELVTVLEHIVRQRFDEKLIKEKNSHLAQDVLDLAISRKNDRTWADSLDSAERFRLTPMDFGLDVLTAEQRERRLQEVETEVAELIGWGNDDDVGTPRHLFANLRRQLAGNRTGSGARGVAAALHMPKAIWVAANDGSGRDTFVQLMARFLRACGTISREEVVWVDGSELAAASDPGELLSVRLAVASRGCLAIRDAEVLAEARDALRATTVGLGGADSGGTTLVVILGTSSGLGRLSRIEPTLEGRFTTRVCIPDFTAPELVSFIEKEAGNMPSGALTLDSVLAPRLIDHLNETYGGGGQGKELGENGNLSLARRLLQKAVQNRITRLFNRIQEGEHPGGEPESEQLTLADFEVGASLGEGVEQKAAIDEEVGNLIGMDKAKEWFQQVRQKVAFVEQTGTRSDLRVCLNIIITGNPGTGKTTFARLLAKFFYTYGALPKDSFVEKNGLELKAEYMGGTAPRVKAAVQEAMGGCLFLDEAYALIDSNAGIGGGGDGFSQEAMRTLLTEVENHRTNLMVVLAGYKGKMGRMMRAEEGLTRRFPSRLHLDDYTPHELAAICEMVSRTKHQREFEPGLKEKLTTHIENFYWRDISQQNAGLSVNLTEKALDRQIVRIVTKYPQAFTDPAMRQTQRFDHHAPLARQRSAVSMQQIKEEVSTFTAADFGIEERPTLGDPELRQRVQTEVDRLTGMANVKQFFEQMARTVAFVERGGDPRVLQTSLNLRLTGNPGTGKTTVARLIGKFLYAHGVLPRDTFVERNALALKGQFVGQTAPTVVEAVRDAMGGCLFIDEAYALADRGGDKFSGEVVRTLLTEVENHRTGLLVVLAGYADKMEWLMDSDPGLRRRFSLVLQMEDYSPDELANICETAALDRFRLTFAPGLRTALPRHIEKVHGKDISQHNGGLAVTLAERAFRRLATRLGDPTIDTAIHGESSRQLTAEDFEIDVEISSPVSTRLAAYRGIKNVACAGGSCPTDDQPRAVKRGRPEWQSAVNSLARGLARELLLCVEGDVGDNDLDDDMGDGSAPNRGSGQGPDRTGAVTKALVKARAKERETIAVKEEEALPQQEGERVVEEMSTREALDHLGLCPANFEWFELNIAGLPDENCGICNYKLADGYRCGGGTHFVCMGCIDAYKTKQVD